MPRPIVGQFREEKHAHHLLNLSAGEHTDIRENRTDRIKADRLLRKQRSKKYMEALCRLDAGGHVHNREKVDEIINIILDEFPELEIKGVLLGIVAICYLGDPYEVHILDLVGEIVEHYKKGKPLPNGMEKARSIALRGGYEFIEVYTDCCRAVSLTGTVSVIPN